MNLLFVADPLASFKVYKDSTYAMMAEADRRGHGLWACEPQDLLWKDGRVLGQASRITLTPTSGQPALDPPPLAGDGRVGAEQEHSMNPIVIIGSGMAGYTLLREFRKRDAERPVTLITADDGRAYSKPNLSNALAQRRAPAQLASENAEQAAAKYGARILTHTRAVCACRMGLKSSRPYKHGKKLSSLQIRLFILYSTWAPRWFGAAKFLRPTFLLQVQAR